MHLNHKRHKVALWVTLFSQRW